MRATRAYITSFGTTGLLIASALLMLTVTSAFVAFNGFPGQSVEDPIGSLLVKEHQATVTVPAKPVHVRAPDSKSRSGAATVRHASARRADAPVASTGPVQDRARSGTPTGTQSPATAPQSSTAPATDTVTQQLPGGTPSLNDNGLPSTGVTLPSVELPPPPDTQLPLDTSDVSGTVNSVTGTLNGP